MLVLGASASSLSIRTTHPPLHPLAIRPTNWLVTRRRLFLRQIFLLPVRLPFRRYPRLGFRTPKSLIPPLVLLRPFRIYDDLLRRHPLLLLLALRQQIRPVLRLRPHPP